MHLGSFPQEELHLSPAEMSWVMGKFAEGYFDPDKAAKEVAESLGIRLYTEYKVVVHYDWA